MNDVASAPGRCLFGFLGGLLGATPVTGGSWNGACSRGCMGRLRCPVWAVARMVLVATVIVVIVVVTAAAAPMLGTKLVSLLWTCSNMLRSGTIISSYVRH